MSVNIHVNRFLDITLSGQHNITTGKIYREVLTIISRWSSVLCLHPTSPMLLLLGHQVIDRERRGDYLGKTVQIVPHATDMIISWIKDVAKRPVDGSGATPDVCLIEVRPP